MYVYMYVCNTLLVGHVGTPEEIAEGCLHVFTCTNMYVCIYLHVQICIYVFIYIYIIFMYVCIHVCTYIHTYM
jgi:hypothetical protein